MAHRVFLLTFIDIENNFVDPFNLKNIYNIIYHFPEHQILHFANYSQKATAWSKLKYFATAK